MNIPIPNIRRECSACYELLSITHWEFNTNIEPIYTIGSDRPVLIQKHHTQYTLKGYCFRCRCEVTRKYVEVNDVFILQSESYYQDGGRDTHHFGVELGLH